MKCIDWDLRAVLQDTKNEDNYFAQGKLGELDLFVN